MPLALFAFRKYTFLLKHVFGFPSFCWYNTKTPNVWLNAVNTDFNNCSSGEFFFFKQCWVKNFVSHPLLTEKSYKHDQTCYFECFTGIARGPRSDALSIDLKCIVIIPKFSTFLPYFFWLSQKWTMIKLQNFKLFILIMLQIFWFTHGTQLILDISVWLRNWHFRQFSQECFETTHFVML